jgi:hypothetical protein
MTNACVNPERAPWQQEIPDYVITAKKPTCFAQYNLVRWGKLKRLV